MNPKNKPHGHTDIMHAAKNLIDACALDMEAKVIGKRAQYLKEVVENFTEIHGRKSYCYSDGDFSYTFLKCLSDSKDRYRYISIYEDAEYDIFLNIYDDREIIKRIGQEEFAKMKKALE